MLPRHVRTRVVHRPVEELHADPPFIPDPLCLAQERLEYAVGVQVRPAVRLAVEEPAVAAPAHAGGLVGGVVLMALPQWGRELLRVDDLDEKHLCDVKGGDELLHAGPQRLVGVGGHEVVRGRVAVDAAGDVECVEAGAEVGPVDQRHNLPQLVPRVDVRAPAQVLVGEAHRSALGCGGQVGHLAQVRHDDFEVRGELLGGEEVGRDLDGVCAQGAGEAEPVLHLVDAGGVLLAVAEPLVVHKGLEDEDLEAAGCAEAFDVVGGGELVAVELLIGVVLEVLVEDFHPFEAVVGGLVELGLEFVVPRSPQ